LEVSVRKTGALIGAGNARSKIKIDGRWCHNENLRGRSVTENTALYENCKWLSNAVLSYTAGKTTVTTSATNADVSKG
jgi:hypothetical protein